MFDLLAQIIGLKIQTANSLHSRLSCTVLKSECKQLCFKLCNIFFVFVLNFGKAALQFIKPDHTSDVSLFLKICCQQKVNCTDGVMLTIAYQI